MLIRVALVTSHDLSFWADGILLIPAFVLAFTFSTMLLEVDLLFYNFWIVLVMVAP